MEGDTTNTGKAYQSKDASHVHSTGPSYHGMLPTLGCIDEGNDSIDDGDPIANPDGRRCNGVQRTEYTSNTIHLGAYSMHHHTTSSFPMVQVWRNGGYLRVDADMQGHTFHPPDRWGFL